MYQLAQILHNRCAGHDSRDKSQLWEMVLLFQVHTILSPGDNLGLVIRGGAEYGVSWSFGW